jgi:hypothetical protein
MIDLTIEPPSMAAEASRIVTICMENLDPRACTNVVVGLDIPPDIGLEQGRGEFAITHLAAGEVYEHALRVRPPHPGRFTIGVPNLSFRNAYGQSRRERGRSVELVVEPAAELLAVPSAGTSQNIGWPLRRPTIFVSYRRSDAKMMVPGLARDLGRRKNLRHADIFLDLKDIRGGEVWPEVLERELRECALLIAVIGPEWLSATTANGRRLDDPDDTVRQEIATALRRGIPIIPLLVDAPMPTAATLPPVVRPLTMRQAFAFNLADYDRSLENLSEQVRALLAPTFAC